MGKVQKNNWNVGNKKVPHVINEYFKQFIMFTPSLILKRQIGYVFKHLPTLKWIYIGI